MRLRDIGIYAGTDIAVKAVGLVLSPLVTRLLTQGQYGAVSLLDGMWSVLYMVRLAGMEEAYGYFRAKDTRRTDGPEILTAATWNVLSALALTWTGAALCAGAGGWAARYTGLSRCEVLLYLLAMLPMALNGWFGFLLRYAHHPGGYARVTLGCRLGALVLVPCLFWLDPSVRLRGYFAAIGTLEVPGLLIAAREFRRLGLSPLRRRPGMGRWMGAMLKCGLVLVPAGVLSAVSAMSGRLLLGALSTPPVVAVFALAVTLTVPMLYFKRWFQFVWSPEVVDWVASRDEARYVGKIQSALDNAGPVLAGLSLLLTLWADVVVALLYPAQYAPSARLVPLLAAATALSVLSSVAATTTLIADAPRFQTPVYAAALGVNALASLLAIPRLGAAGAVLGVLAGEVTLLAVWIAVGTRVLGNLKLDWRVPLLWMAGAALCAAAAGARGFGGHGGLGWRLLATGLVAAGVGWARRDLANRVFTSAGRLLRRLAGKTS